MKCITIIVHASTKDALTDFFHGIPEIQRFTMIDCEGYDENDLVDPLISAGDRVVGYIPRLRIDLLVPDEQIKMVFSALRGNQSQVIGLGVYWVTPIEDSGSL